MPDLIKPINVFPMTLILPFPVYCCGKA